MDDLISEFITETNESLEELDRDLVNLERNPNDKDLLSKIFRLMHTIKGTCGFLGLPRLEKVAHHAENVLGLFRDGNLEVTPEYVTLIFESIDAIKLIVTAIASTGSEIEGDDTALIEKLDAVYEGRDQGAVGESAETQETGGQDLFNEVPPSEDEEHVDTGDSDQSVQTAESVEDVISGDKMETAALEVPVGPQSLRVNVEVLEDLMTMVSELVLTRNQLLQIMRKSTETEFTTPLQRLNHVVSDLQEGVMKTRMQPIGNAWSKLPRIIRDLSVELGKKIDLEMRGQDTELDRQVLDLIKDPLTHMVRNSGDHGIETPQDRLAAGKPETGRILLEAYHEGGHIIIRISDDGKGLSTEKIKKKVIEKNLATGEELESLSTQQIQQFIFRAGFSTAEKVTSVSGRGVGMDVVRTNIEKIGGSIELRSEEGKGSTFIIKIPLTLAIVSALIVEAAAERFAIPQLAVRELVMASEHGDNRIETIKGASVLRLRERLLPLVSLTDLLNLKGIAPAPDNERTDSKKETPENRNHYIVVTQVGSYDFGLIVDKVFDTEEIVVKPVASILKNIELFSGNTILGDGSVIMILDPNGIAKVAGNLETTDTGAGEEKDQAQSSKEDEKTSLLLFKVARDNTPKAVPLSLVARLETVKTASIEYSSGQMMVQYRNKLMSLTSFENDNGFKEKEEVPVLVFTDEDRIMGLIVDDILDIKEEYVDVQIETNKEGIIGSAIINQKATDVIDVGYFLSQVNENWFKKHDDTPFKGQAAKNANGKKRILLVDDSPFFRNMISPMLNIAGYEVTSLESPVQALEMCEKGERFDIILSDIEMPDMDGFEFAEKIKTQTSWQDIPLVALSSHATPQDIDRGRQVGYTRHVAKFDRDTLLDTLSATLSESEGGTK